MCHSSIHCVCGYGWGCTCYLHAYMFTAEDTRGCVGCGLDGVGGEDCAPLGIRVHLQLASQNPVVEAHIEELGEKKF